MSPPPLIPTIAYLQTSFRGASIVNLVIAGLVLLFAAFFVLITAAIFIAALWEKQPISTYKRRDDAPPPPGSPAAPAPSPYLQEMERAIGAAGLAHPVAAGHSKGGTYRLLASAWLTPTRDTLVTAAGGTLARLTVRRTILQTWAGDRLLLTTDEFGSTDISGVVDQVLVKNADFPELLATHLARLQPIRHLVRPYPAASDPLACLASDNRARADALVRRGYVRFTTPEQTVVRYTLRGAVALTFASVVGMFTTGQAERTKVPRPGDKAYVRPPPPPPFPLRPQNPLGDPMTEKLEQVAARHGFTPSAVAAALEALRRGGGVMAQFNHPELGGSGQWMSGAVMIGDMFNDALKARVAALFAELAGSSAATRSVERETPPSTTTLRYASADLGESWYPAAFGQPDAAGAQDEVRYAFFAGPRRLVLRIGERSTVYDTGEHLISGIAQRQDSGGGSLTFRSQLGVVSLDQLKIVPT